MRILSVIPVMGVGGAEVVAAALVRDAHARGYQVCLASAGGFRADALAADGLETFTLPLASRRPSDLWRSARALRRYARRVGPDLITAHNVKAALVARAAVGRRTPIVTTLHGVAESDLAIAARILRHTSDHVIAVSPHVAERLRVHGQPPSRTTVVENAVGPLPVHDRDSVRSDLGIGPDRAVVLCSARLVEQKRHDLLLRAWATLPDDPLLLIAGDGPRRPALEVLADRLGIAGRVRFLGERTDIDRLLGAADVCALATDWEGMPISLLEAMTLRVPVVVSRVPGVVETLGEAVELVEPGSVQALAQALGDLLADPVRRAALGRRGAELVSARFAPETMTRAHDRVHRAVLGIDLGEEALR